MVLNELEKGLRHHSLITNDEQRKRFTEIIGIVKREYEEIVKNEVQRAISADEDAIAKLAGELHRQHQGLHAQGAGQEPLHRRRTKSRTSA